MQQRPRAQADPIRALHGMLGLMPSALLLCYCRGALLCRCVCQQQLTT